MTAGLRTAAPAIVQDFFQDSTPQKLATKKDICAGSAPPAAHSHFFTASQKFGSLDETGKQVDDGSYLAQAPDLYICDSKLPDCTPPGANGHWHYTISGDQLQLTPVIKPAQRVSALAHPLDFSQAAWMVSLALPSHAWTRTSCSRC